MEPIVTESASGLVIRLNTNGDEASLAPHQELEITAISGVKVRLIAEQKAVRCHASCEGSSRLPSTSYDFILHPNCAANDVQATTLEQLISNYQVALNGRW